MLLFVSAKVVATGKSNMFGAKKDIRELEMEGGKKREESGREVCKRRQKVKSQKFSL